MLYLRWQRIRLGRKIMKQIIKINEEEIRRQAAWNLLTNDQKNAAINPELDLGKWIAFILCVLFASLLLISWGYRLFK